MYSAHSCLYPLLVSVLLRRFGLLFSVLLSLFLCQFLCLFFFFFFSSRRRHTRCLSDWSSDVCSSDLRLAGLLQPLGRSRACAATTMHAAATISHGRTLTGPSRSRAGPAARGAVKITGWVPIPEPRSEERRVGKGCRARASPYRQKQKM